MHPFPSLRSARRGFGVIESVAALAMVGVLAAVALPGFRDAQLRSRRVDATQSLQRLYALQEQYRFEHGHYAESLSLLPGPNNGQSTLGRYEIGLRLVGEDGYELLARPRGPQAEDKACPAFTLRVAGFFSTQGPEAGCWPA